MILSLLIAASALLQSLGPDAGLVERSVRAGRDGRSVSRLQQTFQGHRVWGVEAIAVRNPGGRVRVAGSERGVAVSGEPRIDEGKAAQIALRALGARGEVQHTAELIVFPTRFTGGIVTSADRAGRVTIDRAHSVIARRPAGDYVWAWEVRTVAMNAQDGHREERYVVDARTGSILRKWSALKGVGEGHSYFRGTVPLATSQDGDGTYRLLAKDRGTLPQPFFAANGGGNQVGLGTYSGYFNLGHGFSGFAPYAGHATDSWGDGSHYPIAWNFLLGLITLDYSADHSQAWPTGAFAPSGETTAVDAHFGMTAAWDFLHDVLGRDGIDGLGTSAMTVVHVIRGSTPTQSAPLVDTAYWSPSLFGMIIGDGSAPYLPGGWITLTGVDIIGHEVGHGVSMSEVDFVPGGLSSALDEGNSDIFGKLLQAWVDGGRGAAVPEFDPADATRWELGLGGFLDGGFLRAMDRPSDDGTSGDNWYDGLEELGSHASSGPVDRFFVLLAQGVSTDPASRRSSAFLPGGMDGIGLDRAARIWYRALTEKLLAADDFDAARAATVAAAGELYGAGSAEEQAVMKAWAAVNVGSAPGEGPRVRVTFPVTNGPGSFLDQQAVPAGILSRVQFFPTSAKVRIRADVENTADHSLTWSLAAPNGGYVAGSIDANGVWTTPSFPYYGDLLTVVATSVAEPRQYAKGHALLISMDADVDGQADALDLGAVAMSWGVVQPPNQAVELAGSGFVDDWDLVFFAEAAANGWPTGSTP